MPDSLIALLVALLGGAAVGVERQWSGHATGPQARFAGVRTFALLGALGGIAGRLWVWDAQPLAAIVLALGGLLVLAGYLAASGHDVDATTETAALIVIAAGVTAGLGQTGVASGIAAVTALLLFEKSQLHDLVGRLEGPELSAAFRFAVMAVVILPLLPPGPFGTWGGGFRPRQLWSLVLLFSGLSFLGYIAQRAIGVSRGYVVAGLLGGMVSSTSVTLGFARQSREPSAPGAPAGARRGRGEHGALRARARRRRDSQPGPGVDARPGAGRAGRGRRDCRVVGRSAIAGDRNLRGYACPAIRCSCAARSRWRSSSSWSWFWLTPLAAASAAAGCSDGSSARADRRRCADLVDGAGGGARSGAGGLAARAVTMGLLSNTLVKTAMSVAAGEGDVPANDEHGTAASWRARSPRRSSCWVESGSAIGRWDDEDRDAGGFEYILAGRSEQEPLRAAEATHPHDDHVGVALGSLGEDFRSRLADADADCHRRGQFRRGSIEQLPELLLSLRVEHVVGPGRARASAEQRVHDRHDRHVPGGRACEAQRRCQRAFRSGEKSTEHRM